MQSGGIQHLVPWLNCLCQVHGGLDLFAVIFKHCTLSGRPFFPHTHEHLFSLFAVFHQLLYHWMVQGCVSEEAADVRVSPPQVVRDDLAATQIIDFKAEVAIALVRFVESSVGVFTQERSA